MPRVTGTDGVVDLEELLASTGFWLGAWVCSPYFRQLEAHKREPAYGSAKSRYRIDQEVARGGMGIVFRARDRDLGRRVALKVQRSPEGVSKDEERSRIRTALSRFLTEAQVTSQLDHPGIVPVYDFGIGPANAIYYTMPFIRGISFERVIQFVHGKRKNWDLQRGLGVLIRVCEAMAYAHSMQVVHRDLKPGNILVGRFGATYVIDWGLARVLDRERACDLNRTGSDSVHLSAHIPDSSTFTDQTTSTVCGDIVGTFPYMSLEQAQGQNAGTSADIYAMGAILYHLLAGRAPYARAKRARGNEVLLCRILRGPPTPIQKLVPDVPGELAALCERAMDRDPGERFSMREFGDRLRRFHESGPLQQEGGLLSRMALRCGFKSSRPKAREPLARGERHRARRELEEVQRHRFDGAQMTLDLLVSASRVGTWDWKIEENDLVWNAEMLELWGYTADDFPGTYSGFLDRVAPEDRESISAAVEHCLETGVPFSTTYAVCRPNAPRQQIDARGSVLFDEEGKPYRMVGICLPVHEQRTPIADGRTPKAVLPGVS